MDGVGCGVYGWGVWDVRQQHFHSFNWEGGRTSPWGKGLGDLTFTCNLYITHEQLL